MRNPFCANTDAYRLEHITRCLFDKESKAIWCLRGGYGSMRIVDSLIKLDRKPEKAKLFIGFSDITVLHIFLNQFWQWNTIHGKVLTQYTKHRICKESVRQMKDLFNGKKILKYFGLEALNESFAGDKIIEGELFGGNLALISYSIGTAWQANTKGKILFLEDVDEKAYQIDRYFEHLWQAGLFNNIKALILGEFINCNEKNGTNLVKFAIDRLVKKLNIPIFVFNKFGHGDKNVPLPIGTNCKISINKKISLICDSGVINNYG